MNPDGTTPNTGGAIVVNDDGNANRSGNAATTITNYAGATITGGATYAIRLENKGDDTIDADRITNYGTITGNGVIPDPNGSVNYTTGGQPAPDPNSVGTLNGVTYTGTGSARFIRGDGAAIQMGEGTDVLANYGMITGNSGRAISLEGGDDTLDVYTGSVITGQIDGGVGSDTLNLRQDDRSGAGASGANSNATTGTLTNVANFETLNVQSGAWIVTDAQSYTSGAAISAGAILQIGSGGAGSSFAGPIVDAGTLAFNESDVTSYAGTLTGAGALTKLGTGTLSLTGANGGFSGAVGLTSGILDLTQQNSAGTGTISFGTGSQVLRLNATSGTLGASVAGFAVGDVIDLTALNPAGATASFNGSTLTVSGSAAVGGGAFTETITINAATAGYQYSVVADTTGAGGADVVLTATPPSAGGGTSSPSTASSTGADRLAGSPTGNDTIAGLQGDDTIQGGSGNQLLLGNQGNDVITAGDGQNTIAGGMDNDRITVGNGSNLLYGNEGSDTIQAGNGGNTIVGGQDSTDGADLITSGIGNDLILGNGGDDTVAAGGGADTVVGGYGRDILLGNQGNDFLLGNQGDDTLFGGQGADTLVGGMGNDVLYGNEGDDVLYGNEGLNTFVFAPGDTDFRSGVSTGDTVADFTTGTSRIDFASGPVGTASDFATAQTTSTDFAQIQALAQTLFTGPVSYVFVANGVDGFLFTTGGRARPSRMR